MSESSCNICLADLTEAEITECGHSFHTGCLREWLIKGSASCPTCRKSIQSPLTDIDTLRTSVFIPSEDGTEAVLRMDNGIVRQTYGRTVRFTPLQTDPTSLELQALSYVILPGNLRDMRVTIRSLTKKCRECNKNTVEFILNSPSGTRKRIFCPSCQVNNLLFS